MGGRGSQEEEDEDVERKEKIISGSKRKVKMDDTIDEKIRGNEKK